MDEKQVDFGMDWNSTRLGKHPRNHLMDRRNSFSGLKILTFAFLFLLASLPAKTQCCGAMIVGTVSDPEGAVIPNAKVTITNVASGTHIKTVTNQMGEFRATSLRLGSYKVKVSAKGFHTVETPARTLEIDQTLRFDVTLPTKTALRSK